MRSLLTPLLVASIISLGISATASESPTEPPTVTLRAPATSALLPHYLDGVAAGLIVTPASLVLATWVGTLSSNLIVAALSGVLIAVVLPPLAITAAQWWSTRRDGDKSVRMRPALWVALGVHVAVVVAAILLGVSTHQLGEAAAFVAVDAFVVPAASVLTMHWSRSAPRVASILETSPHFLLPLVEVNF